MIHPRPILSQSKELQLKSQSPDDDERVLDRDRDREEEAMAALDDHSPDEIFCDSDVFDIDFHPTADIVALGTISGVVQVYVRCALAYASNGFALLRHDVLHACWSAASHPLLTNVCWYYCCCCCVRVCSYKYSEEANTQVLELKHHLDAVRGVLFAPDGQSTFAALRLSMISCTLANFVVCLQLCTLPRLISPSALSTRWATLPGPSSEHTSASISPIRWVVVVR